MIKKTLLVVLLCVIALGLASTGLAQAQQPSVSVTRVISPSSVPAGGGEVTVTVRINGYQGIGLVEETLPTGFTYVDGSADITPTENGRKLSFPLVSETSFTYKVDTSSTAGQHPFSGKLTYGIDKTLVTVGGDSSVEVQQAQQPSVSVTRVISPDSVPADGGEVTVTVIINGYEGIGLVEETLPTGFTYVDGSADITPTENGRKLSFPLVSETSFTYKVDTSSTAGQHPFSGKLTYGIDKTLVTVGGDSSVEVQQAQQPSVSVTRSISPDSVPADGGEVTVTVIINGYQGIGLVEETLPTGFTYVDGSADITPTENGRKLSFPLVSETSFTYKVDTSSTAGQHPFSGEFTYGIDKTLVTVGGDSSVEVQQAQQPSVSVTRSISPDSVPADGGEVTVTVIINGYQGIGLVEETLPTGFTYVDGSADITPTENGRKLSFPLVSETSVTYKVDTSSTAGQHPFSGEFTYGIDKTLVTVGGASIVTVGSPAPQPQPQPQPQPNRAPVFPSSSTTRSIDENSASGANVGAAVRAIDADRDTLTYSLTGTDAASFTINSSGQIMVGTGTMLDFEDKASYTVTVTATDGSASDTITVTVTVGNADDPGMVTIMPGTTPQVGTELTASLEDQDGSVVNLTWQWQKDDGQGSYADIPGETMVSYTPVMADDGSRLQATAMYDDGEGSGKTALGMTANAVGATGDIVSRYDTDGNGISEIEASIAVLDYLIRGDITRDEAIQVVTAYHEDPLIVGHLNTVTGSLSYFGREQNNGVELAALHVNQAGGVHGAQMIIVTGDTATNPVQGVAAARALVDVEGAVAIVGALASGVTLAVAQSVTVPKQRLLISPASTSPAITVLEDDDFLFRTTVSDAAQGVVLARLAWDNGYETAGIMLINNAYGEGLADQFEETFVSLGGRVTGKVPHEDSQPTYTSELEKATEGDPDVLLAISYPGQAEVYLRESLEGGYSDTFLFVDGTKSPEMMEVVGWEALEGMLGTAQGSPESPSLLEFQGSYAAVHGSPPEHPFIAENYDAAVLIALAAAKAGTTTDSVAIRDALRSIANPPGEAVGPGVEGIKKALMLIAEGKDINYEGAAGTVDFDENGDVTGYIEIWKVEGGEIKSTGRFELP